ncbi:hypothetical protein PoB_007194800 [Plakobranchus ocellatus]|uniref:Uncharacterized protein n=1 Tax=Plakobranchus ocellatus TaxID=259542 RepID=A0AAV4DMZ1_9GAST|nr:hypothetical protein PoB_007194800 [Plakobranchus ocellatus]
MVPADLSVGSLSTLPPTPVSSVGIIMEYCAAVLQDLYKRPPQDAQLSAFYQMHNKVISGFQALRQAKASAARIRNRRVLAHLIADRLATVP